MTISIPANIIPGAIAVAGPAGAQGQQGEPGQQGVPGQQGNPGTAGPTGPAPISTPIPWTSGLTCVVGPPATAVFYNGLIYICTTSHISGSVFDPTKWQQWLQGTGQLLQANNLSDVSNAATALGNLGGASISGTNSFTGSNSFSVSPTAPTASATDSSTKVATTAFGYALLGTALRGYLAGLTLSNDGGTPNTVLDISVGVATSDDETTFMSLGSTYFKSISSTWAVGAGSTGSPTGALDSGSVAANTKYYVYLIKRTDTGVTDVLFSTSATLPTLPANYTKKRRIGMIMTDGSSHILGFVQNGDRFDWAAPPTDVNAATLTTSAALLSLSVPLIAGTMAIFNALANCTATTEVAFSNPAINDVAPSASYFSLAVFGSNFATGEFQVVTDGFGRIRSRASSTSGTLTIVTTGWIDTRGKAA